MYSQVSAKMNLGRGVRQKEYHLCAQMVRVSALHWLIAFGNNYQIMVVKTTHICPDLSNPTQKGAKQSNQHLPAALVHP
jgi:hypothetical protein